MANQEQKGADIGIYVDVEGTMTLVAARRNFELEETTEGIDIGHEGTGGWVRRMAGQQDWSASIDSVLLLDDVTGSFEASHKAIRDAKRAGETVTVEVRYPGSEDHKDQGEAIVTSITLTSPYNEEATVALELSAAGELTYE